MDWNKTEECHQSFADAFGRQGLHKLCRQSACLSLGHIKAEEGVPKISYLW